MNIGKIKFSSNLIQAPLAGISCAPFRVLAHEFGNPAYCVSEMVSAHNLVNPKVRNAEKFKRYIYKDPKEGVYAMQISGENPEILAEASKIAIDLGADIIDLNCGCPKRKIRKKGCGSKHLENTDNLFRCVSAMKNSISSYISDSSIPLTVKIRLSSNINNDINIVQGLERIGVDAVTIHGRTWKQGYDELINYKRIKNIVDSVNIPIIGNGDIKDKSSLDKMQKTGCAGFMIARSSIGNPWIFQELNDGNKIILSKQIIDEVIERHFVGLCAFGGPDCARDQMYRIKKKYLLLINC